MFLYLVMVLVLRLVCVVESVCNPRVVLELLQHVLMPDDPVVTVIP